MTIEISNRTVGLNHPCFIIAEVSSNHGNDLNRAKKMIEEAALAGADAVKFQVFTAEMIAADTDDPRTIVRASEKSVFVKKDSKLIDLYRPNELPRSWLPELASHAKRHGILFLATPFDTLAVDQLEEIDVPAYKNASYELLDVPLLRKMGKTGKPVILSTGMADIEEIRTAIDIASQAGSKQIALLHCNSTYPTPLEDVNLRAMETMAKAFPACPIGFSDHSVGIEISIAAVAMGASILEKHFMLEDGVSTIDDQFSITTRQLKEMVTCIRNVERAKGSHEKKATMLEEREKILARRSLWVVKDVKKGERLTDDNIKSLRPGIGLSTLQYDFILQQKAARDIKAGSPLQERDF